MNEQEIDQSVTVPDASRSEIDSATSWYQEYVRLADDWFGVVENLADFLSRFIAQGFVYENNWEKKMDPKNVRAGKISCSSAVLLLGCWWRKVTGNHLWYILPQEGSPGFDQHVYAYGARNPDLLDVGALDRIQRFRLDLLQPPSRDNMMEEFTADYTIKHGLRLMPPSRGLPVVPQLIHSDLEFLRNRLDHFSFYTYD